MDESILDSIKHDLGIDTCCDAFDQDIKMHIQSVLSTLYQIGVDSARKVPDIDKSVKWGDIFSDDSDLLPMIKQYVYLKIRVVFDPPNSSFVLESCNKQIDELEWRINIEAEGGFEDLPKIKKTRKKSSELWNEEDC